MQGLVLLWAFWAGGLLGTGNTQESGGSVCGQTTPLPTLGHTLQQVSDGLQLVTSTVDAKGQLVSCELQGAPETVGAFMHMCRAGSQGKAAAGIQYPGLVGAGGTQDPGLEGFAGARLACQIFLKDRGIGTPRDQSQPHAQGGLQRSKRGFTYPGTLWCGAGNSAENDQQLGELKETDACCREHDHCQHVIHPFTNNYGYRNMRWHTISHCACDNEMKDCLRKVNDTAARVVGQAFFNVIQVPCFEFMYEEQCVERFWYGWCKRYNTVAVAVPQPPVLYDYGGDLIDRVTTTKPKNQTTESLTPPQASSTAQPTGTSAQSRGPKAQPLGTTARPQTTTIGQLGSKARSLGTTARPPGITVEHSSDPSTTPTLGQVIQVTEDLLKVMVTTISPSTTTDSKTESADKKQRKNKKNKEEGKKRRKGKGLKGKKKARPISEDFTPTSLVVSATPPVANKDLWVESLGKAQDGELEHLLFDQSLDLGGNQVVFNDVLNDEPGRDEVQLSKSTLATLTTNHPTKKTVAPTPTKATANAEGQKKKRRRKDGKGRKRLRENARSNREDLGI